MTKSKFAESLSGLSQDQLARVTADLVAEQARRGTGTSDYSNAAYMSDSDFERLKNRAFAESAAGAHARVLESEAAKSGKILVDPKAAAEQTEGNGNDAA